MIQFEPLLGMATIGLALDVPVVPMHSLLQFFDGRRVECHDDWKLLSDFYKSCLEKVIFFELTMIIELTRMIDMANSGHVHDAVVDRE